MKERVLFNKIANNYNSKDYHPVCIVARMHRLHSTLKYSETKNKSVLEIGCGAGHSIKYLSSEYSSYTGIDVSENLINLAKSQYSSSYPNTSFIATSLENFDTSYKFDVIFMVGVLHHVECQNQFLSKLIKLSHDKTIFAFNEPMESSYIISFVRKFRMMIDKSYSNDQCFFKRNNLLSILENHGFYIIKTKNQGFLSTPFAEIKLKPITFFLPLSLLCTLLDKAICKLPNFITQVFSWNIVVAAKRKNI